MNRSESTDGATAATETNRKYTDPASRERNPAPPPPRVVIVNFREAEFAARPPCYR